MDREQRKASYIIIGATFGIFLLVILYLVITNRNDSKNFPGYENIDFNESEMQDENSTTYKNARDRLQKDHYFANEMTLGEFDYKTYTEIMTDENYDISNYTGATFRDLIWHYIYAFESSNMEYMTLYSSAEEKFCLKRNYVIEGFKELYNVDISSQIDYLPGYLEYVTKNANSSYCFNFGQVLSEYDQEIKIGVERISVIGSDITTDIFVYEYYNHGADDQEDAVSRLETYLDNQAYDLANELVENELYGTVTHKQVRLKRNSSGKFFKYQILSVKILDY